MLNIRHLQTLATIAEYGSFKTAAERLCITLSAVSMQMKALEQELQSELFDRTKRSPVLNELGHSVVDTAREIILLSEDLRQAAAAPGELTGILRLGVISSVSTGALPEALVSLNKLHPQLNVKIENGFSQDLVQRVSQGILDAAVVTEPPRVDSGLICKTVVEEPLLVIAPKNLAGTSDRELLSKLPFARFNRRAGVGRIINDALRNRKIKVRDTMELDSIEAILQMVSRGLGTAVVPEHCVTARFIRMLHVVPFGEPPYRRKVGLVERVRHQRSNLTGALFDELRKAEELRKKPLSQAVGVA